jgi:hypothetical protein
MASKSEIVEFLAREFPTGRVRVQQVGEGSATVVHDIGSDDLRP